MADHLIIQVRDAILAQITGLTTTGAHAFLLTEVPEDESVLPCVAIEYQDDTSEPIGLGFPGPTNLGAVYIIHCVVKQKGDSEKAAFLVRKEVEAALFGTALAKTLNGLVLWIRAVGGDSDRSEKLNVPGYSARLQVQAMIRHLESRPDSIAIP
jgi:hypothetical protein